VKRARRTLKVSRGLSPIREISREQFEKMFNNDLGFTRGRLSSSGYAAWGANSKNPSSTVFEAFFELDQVKPNPVKDQNLVKGSAADAFRSSYAEKICDFFSTFYDPGNSPKFKSNSTQDPAFDGFAVMPWLVPDIILLNFQVERGGVSYSWSIIEDSRTFQEDDVVAATFSEYISYCERNYTKFMKIYSSEFDQMGNYVGSLGEFFYSNYKPKN